MLANLNENFRQKGNVELTSKNNVFWLNIFVSSDVKKTLVKAQLQQ